MLHAPPRNKHLIHTVQSSFTEIEYYMIWFHFTQTDPLGIKTSSYLRVNVRVKEPKQTFISVVILTKTRGEILEGKEVNNYTTPGVQDQVQLIRFLSNMLDGLLRGTKTLTRQFLWTVIAPLWYNGPKSSSLTSPRLQNWHVLCVSHTIESLLTSSILK